MCPVAILYQILFQCLDVLDYVEIEALASKKKIRGLLVAAHL